VNNPPGSTSPGAFRHPCRRDPATLRGRGWRRIAGSSGHAGTQGRRPDGTGDEHPEARRGERPESAAPLGVTGESFTTSAGARAAPMGGMWPESRRSPPPSRRAGRPGSGIAPVRGRIRTRAPRCAQS
jgi:hypothetical protein